MHTQAHFLLQGICTPHPRYISLPGSSVTDIPIPDDLQIKPAGISTKSGYGLLVPFLYQQARTVIRVLGDGNCLFRSLSLQLTGTQDHHLKLRKTIVEYEQKSQVFEQLHNAINKTPSFSSHLQNMKKTCVWGTTVEILATSSLFQIDIYVATDSYKPGKAIWLKYSPRTMPTSLDTQLRSVLDTHQSLALQRGWLEIAHVSNCHFDAVKLLARAKLVRPVLQ